MPPSKAKVIERLSEVKNLGEAYATRAYEDLKVRNLEDLIAAAKDNQLQEIKGIGPAKEKAILASAEELAEAQSEPAPPKKKKSKAKKSTSKSKADDKKSEPKAATEEPKASAKKEKPSAKKSASRSNGSTRSERPRTTYRPPSQSRGRPSIPGLLFKLGKKIIGRILG